MERAEPFGSARPKLAYTTFFAAVTRLSTVASAFARSAFASASAVDPFDSVCSLRATKAGVRFHDSLDPEARDGLADDAPAFAKSSPPAEAAKLRRAGAAAGEAERRDGREASDATPMPAPISLYGLRKPHVRLEKVVHDRGNVSLLLAGNPLDEFAHVLFKVDWQIEACAMPAELAALPLREVVFFLHCSLRILSDF